MRQKKNLVLFPIFLSFIFGTMSCAVPPPAALKMTPYIDYSQFTPTEKTLSVAKVKMERKTGSFESPRKSLIITVETFQSALIECLHKSGIFQEIFIDQKGDYELQAQILSEKVIPGLTINVILFVHYSLVDNKVNKVIWKESIVSQYDTYGGEPTNGVEGAVRDNLSQLLTKLSQVASAR